MFKRIQTRNKTNWRGIR